MENKDWFCKCCKDYFKRENPTLIYKGTIDEYYYKAFTMCLRCFDEMNPPEKKIEFELNKNKIEGVSGIKGSIKIEQIPDEEWNKVLIVLITIINTVINDKNNQIHYTAGEPSFEWKRNFTTNTVGKYIDDTIDATDWIQKLKVLFKDNLRKLFIAFETDKILEQLRAMTVVKNNVYDITTHGHWEVISNVFKHNYENILKNSK